MATIPTIRKARRMIDAGIDVRYVADWRSGDNVDSVYVRNYWERDDVPMVIIPDTYTDGLETNTINLANSAALPKNVSFADELVEVTYACRGREWAVTLDNLDNDQVGELIDLIKSLASYPIIDEWEFSEVEERELCDSIENCYLVDILSQFNHEDEMYWAIREDIDEDPAPYVAAIRQTVSEHNFDTSNGEILGLYGRDQYGAELREILAHAVVAAYLAPFGVAPRPMADDE